MIRGINDSKKAYFIWLTVFAVLFAGLCILFTVLNNQSDEKVPMEYMLILYAGSYVAATFPMGWTVRRRLMNWYTHALDFGSKLRITGNIFVNLFNIIKWEVMVSVNLLLLSFYFLVSLVIGPFFNLYFIISGIVFLCKKEI